jgi:hypothetical protein
MTAYTLKMHIDRTLLGRALFPAMFACRPFGWSVLAVIPAGWLVTMKIEDGK